MSEKIFIARKDSVAAGAVQILRTDLENVKKPKLDEFADKEILSIQGKGKLLWVDILENFSDLSTQSGTWIKVMVYIDGKLQANARKGCNGDYYSTGASIYLKIAPPEKFISQGDSAYLPTRVNDMIKSRAWNVFPCSEVEQAHKNVSVAVFDCYYPIEAYIPFNESVEIRVSNTLTGSNTKGKFICAVGYLPDEK